MIFSLSVGCNNVLAFFGLTLDKTFNKSKLNLKTKSKCMRR